MKHKKLLSILILLIIFVITNVWCSYNLLQVNDFEYHSNKINEEMKIMVLADLHDHEFGKHSSYLIDKIHDVNPDLILMAGDFVNVDSQNANILLDIVKQLQNYPIYFGLGNHEISFIEKHSTFLNDLEKLNVHIVDKNYEDITIKNNTLRIGGLYDYAFGADDFNTALKAPKEIINYLSEFQDSNRLKIMISHRPDSFIFGDASKQWKIDLVVNGHNHGGQVVLPFLGGLYGGDQGFFPKYIHGMYRKDNLHIFITSGLGAHTQKLPRFNNIPEIAVIHCYPE